MSSMGALAAPPPPSERPPWNSPVPYLYGGLAAMAGLVVLALLILACSYWKLYGYLHNSSERDLEAGQAEECEGGVKTAPPVLEEKYLVIMAGQKNPTFVATPRSSRDSSFGSSICSTSSCESSTSSEKEEEEEEEKTIENGNTENP